MRRCFFLCVACLVGQKAKVVLSCSEIQASLTLDFRAISGHSQREDVLETELEESTAWIENATSGLRVMRLDGTTECRALDALNTGLITSCRYCLPQGYYILGASDLWGDGWRGASYDLRLENLGSVAAGTVGPGKKSCDWQRPEGAKCAVTIHSEPFEAFRFTFAPTSLEYRFNHEEISVFLQLDWTNAKYKTTRKTARAALGPKSTGEGGQQKTLLRPVAITAPNISTLSSQDIAEDHYWLRFADVQDAAYIVYAEYRLVRGTYVVFLQEDGPSNAGWLRGICSLWDGGWYQPFVEAATISTNEHHNSIEVTIDRSAPTIAPTEIPATLAITFLLDWQQSTDSNPSGSRIELLRRLGENGNSLLTIATLEPLAFQAFSSDVLVRPYDSLFVRIHCWLALDNVDDPWRGGRLRLSLGQETLLEHDGHGCSAPHHYLDLELPDLETVLPPEPTIGPTPAPSSKSPTIEPTTLIPTVSESTAAPSALRSTPSTIVVVERTKESSNKDSTLALLIAVCFVGFVALAALALAGMLLVRIRPMDKGLKSIQQKVLASDDEYKYDDDEPTNPLLLREQPVLGNSSISTHHETVHMNKNSDDDLHGVELLDRNSSNNGASVFIEVSDQQQQQDDDGFDLLQLQDNQASPSFNTSSRAVTVASKHNEEQQDDFTDLAARPRGPSFYHDKDTINEDGYPR